MPGKSEGDEDFGSRLRAGLDEGQPSLALINAWSDLDSWTDQHPEALAEIINAAADLDPSVAGMEGIALESMAVALVDRAGALRVADARFRAWIGDPEDSVDCCRLTHDARVHGRALGLVATEQGGALIVLATSGEGAEKWRRFPSLGPTPNTDRATIALVAFAPSRTKAVMSRSADVHGLNARETSVVTALAGASSLAEAAATLGISRDTAKDAVESAMRKTGAASSTELVARLTAFGGPVGSGTATVDLGSVLGLTPAETRVARALSAGASARGAGVALGLSEQTVTTYRRAVFEKTGVNRIRDLARLLAEIEGLDRLSSVPEVVPNAFEEAGRLRILVDGQGRRVAFIEYGAPGGRTLVMGHAPTSGRTAPPPLLKRLLASGRRVIIPQRPGYGLTSPAREDQLANSAADLSFILERLGESRVEVLSRHASSACAFLTREPGRIARMILINVEEPRGEHVKDPVGAIARLLVSQPALIEPFGRMLMRQSRSDLVRRIVTRIGAGIPADRACAEDPANVEHLVRDAQGLVGPTVNGLVKEIQAHVGGWRPPPSMGGVDVVFARGAGLSETDTAQTWLALPGVRLAMIPDAGWFVQFTHPDALIALLDEP